MNQYENYKKCKICKKNINITQYKSHRRKCESQLVVNPNHMLMNHIQNCKWGGGMATTFSE